MLSHLFNDLVNSIQSQQNRNIYKYTFYVYTQGIHIPPFNNHVQTWFIIKTKWQTYLTILYFAKIATRKCKINELSGEFDFQVPEEPLFYSFFKLDDPDFLDTYLYLPEFSHMLHFPHSSLKSVKNVAGGLTRIFKIPLLGIYEGQRWRLPRLQLYEDGSLSRMSKGFVGENEYDQEWLDTYFERVTENFGKSIDEYLKMISKEPRKKLSKS